MHEESPVRNVYNLDAVDVLQRIDDLFVVRFAARIYGYVTQEEIFADADDINTFNVAAGFADRSGYLAEFSWFIVDLYAKRETVARVGCRRICHEKSMTKNFFVGKRVETEER